MQQGIQNAKTKAMANMATGIVTDFKPMLNDIKTMINDDVSKEKIIQKVDVLLKLINQLEKFSITQKS